MSRWLVGSSSSRRSGSPVSARASEARVSSPPEKVESLRSRSSLAEAQPAQGHERAIAPAVAAAQLEASPGPGRRRPAWRRRGRPRPWPARGGPARPPAPRPPSPRRARSRAGSCSRSRGGRWSNRATFAPFWSASCPPSIGVSPASILSSVVFPDPLRPDRVMRSRRSSLNDTPRSRGAPAMSLLMSAAITTAMSPDQARRRATREPGGTCPSRGHPRPRCARRRSSPSSGRA